MENKFCIIIISHGRPNNIFTLKTLKDAGCTIPTYILIDNDAVKVLKSDLWFWSEEWQRKEAEADKSKKGDTYDSIEEFVKSLSL